MFIPKEFEFTDRAEVIAFMKRYNFAPIVSSADGAPIATHLPFHIMERDGNIVLTSHMAKANVQWKNIEGQTVMLAPATGFYGTAGLGKQEVRLAYVLNLNDINIAMDCLEAALKVYPGKTNWLSVY